MKVAQYEVLGIDAKRDIRPGRDDRNVWLLDYPSTHQHDQPSIVPSGTGSLLKR
jgi:hypothetical protein